MPCGQGAGHDSPAAAERRATSSTCGYRRGNCFHEAWSVAGWRGWRRASGPRGGWGRRPTLRLLDEPAAGLTAGEVDELRDVLLRLHEELKLTMVVVEHNMRFVMKTCSDLAVLSFGRKLAQGSPEEVANNDAVLDAYLGGVL